MTMHQLFAFLTGPDLRAIADVVSRWKWFETEPQFLSIDDEPQPSPAAWQARTPKAVEGFCVDWNRANYGVDPQIITVGFPRRMVPGSVMVAAPAAFERAEDVLSLLADVPFELCSFRPLWHQEWEAAKLSRTGFAWGHTAHGWGCALRGAGHDRLVSRRWLDYWPWRVLRGNGDLTLLQFHDLEANAATALAQAAPCYERIIPYDGGGIVNVHKLLYPPPEGLYDRDTRTVEYVVAGREVSEAEMLAVCSVRWRRRNHPEQPIERAAYVFLTDAEARAHLHALWLRELECWSVEGGVKRRLDLDYVPPPPPAPPAWVRALTG
jgi:hypothetical protein